MRIGDQILNRVLTKALGIGIMITSIYCAVPENYENQKASLITHGMAAHQGKSIMD